VPTELLAVGVVVGALTLLVTLANQAAQLRREVGGRKQVVSVEPDPGSAFRTRDDCNIIHNVIKTSVSESEARTESRLAEAVRESRQGDADSRKELSDETDKLHQRIDTMHTSMNAQFSGIGTAVARVEGIIEAHFQHPAAPQPAKGPQA